MNSFEDTLKQHWLIACSSKILKKKPYACRVLSIPIVLFRHDDKVSALLNQCPHRNVPLSEGKVINKNIQCPYHGWEFNGNGVCKKIPGLCKKITEKKYDIPFFEAKELNGFIWVKINKSSHSIYSPSLLEDKNYYSFHWETKAQGTLINILENFLDGTHTHFVHSGIVRSDKKRQKIKATIERQADSVSIKYTGESLQSGIISRWFEKNRKESFGRYILPSIAEIEYCSNSGTELLITAYIVPEYDNQHNIYAFFSIKRGMIPSILKKWIITPFFKKALKQDLNILKLQDNTIKEFGNENFHFTEIDLIRPHIQSLMLGNKKILNKEISILL